MENNPLSYVPLCISVLALVVSLKNYLRKSGMLVRGNFSIATSRDSHDHYVSSLTLENLKDRAITIFGIYLRLGSNYYIQIEDFEAQPEILKAFETFQKNYEPIAFYGVNTRKIDMESLFTDQRAKKRLVLSTSDGKYVVPKFLPIWNPVIDLFRNHLTAIIKPVRVTYKGRSVGGNIKYVVELTYDNSKEDIVQLHSDDYQIRVFKKFQFTREALDTKAALEQFLAQQKTDGNLTCEAFKVTDMATWRRDDIYTARTFKGSFYSPFRYHVLGRLGTILANMKLRREQQMLKTRVFGINGPENRIKK